MNQALPGLEAILAALGQAPNIGRLGQMQGQFAPPQDKQQPTQFQKIITSGLAQPETINNG